MGAFNPGLARLPNGNLLLMVRVAEALKEPVARRARAGDPLDPSRLCPRSAFAGQQST